MTGPDVSPLPTMKRLQRHILGQLVRNRTCWLVLFVLWTLARLLVVAMLLTVSTWPWLQQWYDEWVELSVPSMFCVILTGVGSVLQHRIFTVKLRCEEDERTSSTSLKSAGWWGWYQPVLFCEFPREHWGRQTGSSYLLCTISPSITLIPGHWSSLFCEPMTKQVGNIPFPQHKTFLCLKCQAPTHPHGCFHFRLVLRTCRGRGHPLLHWHLTSSR